NDRGPLIQQRRQGSQQPGLALPAFAPQYNVMPGNQCALKLGEHGVFKTVQPGPGVVASGQGSQKVTADLLAHGFLDVSGAAKFCQCTDLRGSSHIPYA